MYRSLGYAVAKQWAHFARISADKKVLLSATIEAPGFYLLAGGNRNGRVGSARPHADSVLLS